MNVTTYGLDLAKRVFQVHWVEPETGELKRKALARAEVSASQAVLSLHRMRAQLVKIRTMQGYQVRSLTYEFGVVAPKSWRALLAQVAPLLADPTRSPVPELVRGELLSQLEGATVADARGFRSGREFAAFLGLVPRQSGTGGRVKLLGISKRGDPYLRTLLIHGARSVLRSQSRANRVMDPWLRGVLSRRPKNVAIVALANKMARTIWALMAHGRTFDENWSRTATPAPAVS